MRQLYDDREILNKIGKRFAKEAKSFIQPLIDRCIKRGYSLNESGRIIENEVNFAFAIAKMKRNSNANPRKSNHR